MTIDKVKFLNLLKAIDKLNIFFVLILSFVHPFFPIYDETGTLVESSALLRIAVVIAVFFLAVPYFRKEIKQIEKGKKPFHVGKRNRTLRMPRLNYIIAVVFAICPIVFIPLSIYRYAPEGIQWQAFYALFYPFVYIGIGSRLQMKLALTQHN